MVGHMSVERRVPREAMARRMRRALLGACLISTALAVMACGASEGVARTWQRAVDVSGASAADVPVVVTNLAGDTAIFWVDDEVGVVAVTRHAGGAFSKPRRVARVRSDEIINYPDAAIDGAGNAIAVWQVDDNYGDRPSRLEAVVLARNGRPSKPVTLSRRGDPYGASVAMSAAGDAIAVWTRKTRSGEVVDAATRRAGGRFSRPVRLSADGRKITFADIAMNAGGDAVVAWWRGRGRANVVQATVRRAGGRFSPRVNLSPVTRVAGSVAVAIDPAGDTTVTWNGWDGDAYTAQTVYGPAATGFGMPVTLSAAGNDGSVTEPAMDGAGNTLVAWTESDPDELTTNGVVRISLRAPGGTFSAPANISDAGRFPRLAMNPAGAAVAVWDRGTGDIYSTGVRAAVRAPGGSFSASVLLSGRQQVSALPTVAIDGSGNAIAVWAGRVRRGGRGLMAATYE
jgi:hypothetical protein